jgi:hypothetical protein
MLDWGKKRTTLNAEVKESLKIEREEGLASGR